MTVSDRRRTRAAIWCTLFVGLLLVSSVSAVANDNDDSNNLGLLTSACADNFCRSGVSGLDLWLSLEEVSDMNEPSLPIFRAAVFQLAGVTYSAHIRPGSPGGV